MNSYLSLFFLLFLCLSCKKEVNETTVPPSVETDDETITSTNEFITYIGSISQEDGAHQLVILNNNLYSKRDALIQKFSLTSTENPTLSSSFSHPQGKSYGKIFTKDNSLYIPVPSENKIYVFNENLQTTSTFTSNVAGLSTSIVYIDDNNNFYIAGSNGSRGIIAKCNLNGSQLQEQAAYTFTMIETNVESIAFENNILFISTANGYVHSFDANNISNGPINSVTYENEPGHEKWGKTIQLINQKLYWANWGAGLATLNVSNANNLNVTSVISNSSFRTQFPDSEGTNVYDVAYNVEHGVLCVANGWSGIFLVNPSNPETIIDFLDVDYFQNYCIATKGNYIYTGNISGGVTGNLKGIKIYKLN